MKRFTISGLLLGLVCALAVLSPPAVRAQVAVDDTVLLDPFDPVPEIQFRHFGDNGCYESCGYRRDCDGCGYRHCWRDGCGRLHCRSNCYSRHDRCHQSCWHEIGCERCWDDRAWRFDRDAARMERDHRRFNDDIRTYEDEMDHYQRHYGRDRDWDQDQDWNGDAGYQDDFGPGYGDSGPGPQNGYDDNRYEDQGGDDRYDGNRYDGQRDGDRYNDDYRNGPNDQYNGPH